jgi:4-carboxymuconolactone decarboxylase
MTTPPEEADMSDDDLDMPGAAGGPARRRRAQGLDPELGQWADGFIFGDVWGRPGLSQDERMLVAMTALACGKNPDQLRNYIWGALQAGIPIVKIRETFTMLVVYVGFPVALQALALLKEIERAARKTGLDIDGGVP